MLPLVSEQRREQALRYKHTLGRFCCLKSWLLLQELVGELPEWQYNEYGKPFIEGGPHFSISHCKTGIAVAVADEPVCRRQCRHRIHAPMDPERGCRQMARNGNNVLRTIAIDNREEYIEYRNL